MSEGKITNEAFVCRGQCSVGACILDECIRTHRKRRRWDPPAPVSERLCAPLAPGATPRIGAAIDIGSTTLEMRLLDLESGEQIAGASARNMQARYGSDVISRIEYASSSSARARRLHAVVRRQIAELLDAALACVGLEKDALRLAAVAGNTTMLHLACGLSPEGMGTYPFAPESTFGSMISPGLLGLPPGSEVYIAPCASAFIGADVVCGAMAVRNEGHDGSAILVDLGTNGEIIGWNGDLLSAASTAAGPVFEGGGITCGMPAIAGAVRRVRVRDGKAELNTVDGASPAGLCGSGIVDALAAALELGTLDRSGAIIAGAPYAVREQDGSMSFRLADQVFLTQRDIRLVQDAKAAVSAGIETVQGALLQPGKTPHSLLLAGGLGTAIRSDSAVKVGIVPPQPEAVSVGNAALRGVQQILLDPALKECAEELAAAVQPVDLALDAGFQERFVDEMDFREGGDKT